MFQPRFRVVHDPADAKADAYWLAHAGGCTSTLVQRMRSCDSEIQVRVRCPSMPAREELSGVTFNGDLNRMASLLARQIEAERSQRDSSIPFVLIGHSYGGVLAYRVTSDLSERGITPHRLVVLSSPAPDRPSHDGLLHTLSNEALLQQVDALFGGVPESILEDPQVHEFLVPGLRFDLGLLEGYEHKPADPIAVPIVAVCGMNDRAVSVAQMQGWKRFTSDRFQLRLMPGDHFFPIERMPEILRIALWDVLPG